jgi:hypothetical protein
MTPDRETQTRYLLGDLPEAEEERLDELSVVDDEFADELRAAEADLVDAYAAGELSGARSAQFETRYLASPVRRDRVHFARAFQAWTERQGAGSATPEAKPVRTGWFGRMMSPATPRWAWASAIAALALVVIGGFLFVQNQRLRRDFERSQADRDQLLQRERALQDQIASGKKASDRAAEELAQLRADRERLDQELKDRGQQPPPLGAVVSLVLAPPLRDAGRTPTANLGADAKSIAARLELESSDFATYRVALTDSGGRGLWQSGAVKPVTKGGRSFLAVTIPATSLKTQTYLMRVSGITPGRAPEIIGDYPFRVVK